jgi:hypothetical protein
LAKPFTLEQMKTMLMKWLKPVAREPLLLVSELPISPEPMDDQRNHCGSCIAKVVQMVFKAATRLLADLNTGAATGN